MRSAVTLTKQPSGFGRRFDVLDAFQLLETNRKMALYDILMAGNSNTGSFQRTSEFLWPLATKQDVVKLESFLRRRLNAAD